MNIGESRDFKIGGRVYRDTLLGRDVHQISNPATGHVYGEVVQIPADGRTKAYYLAGPDRERATTWEAAVQAARAQRPDNMPVPVEAAPVVDTAPAPQVPPTMHTPASKQQIEIQDSAPAGWLPAAEAARAHNLPSTQHIYNAYQAGKIAGQRVKCPRTRNGHDWQWMFAPPPAPEPPPPDTTGWLLMDEAIKAYGVSRGTLRRRIDAGTLETVRVPYANNYGYRLLIPPPPVTAPQRATAAAEVTTPSEPTIIVRPAHTRVRELEQQLAALQTRLDAVEAAHKRQSWLDRLFGKGA